MQKWLWLALQSSLAISLVTLVGQSILTRLNLKNQCRYLLAALVLAVFAGFLTFNYWLTNLATKQSFAAQTGLVTILATLLLLFFLWLPAKLLSSKARFLSWLTIFMVAVLTWVLFLDILPYFDNVLAANTAFITTDMIVRLSLGLATIFLTLILTVALSVQLQFWTQTSLNRSPETASYMVKPELLGMSSLTLFKITSTIGLLTLCVLGLTTTLQMLLVLGRLPATPFLFNFVSQLINWQENWLYVLFTSLGFISVAGLLKKTTAVRSKNKAEARKVKAKQRQQRRWASLATATATLIITFAFISQTVASREVQLSAAKELKAANGFVSIDIKEVKDKNLHRFAVNLGNAKVRFLVIYKGAGLFGTAFDACELCGQAGYYQQGNDVICKNCNSVINKATVGFPGGCNPIPLASKIKNGKLLIKVKDIEAKAGVFK